MPKLARNSVVSDKNWSTSGKKSSKSVMVDFTPKFRENARHRTY